LNRTEQSPPYIWVTDRSNLERVAARLEGEPVIGVDLEADSMFHYREKVCLLQISSSSENILIDPLQLPDLSPLAPLFMNPGIRKVFHGADYDIRSLYRDFGIQVNSLFDTQIAARFLGFPETGLALLLQEKLGVTLEKKNQKKDWSVRPLPAGMLAYAVQDTCHLIPLSRLLERELHERGLAFCAEEECERLCRVRPSVPSGAPLSLKFKGAAKLDPRRLALLEYLLQWREKLARARDLPPFKVLGNEPILEIVRRMPRTEKDLEGIAGLSGRQVGRLAASLLTTVDRAMKLPEAELPSFPRACRNPIPARVSGRIKALKGWRERRAAEMGLEASLLCTNAQIESLALAHPRKREDLEGIDALRDWQKKLFGGELCCLLKDLH
jgi:ribonuclease D